MIVQIFRRAKKRISKSSDKYNPTTDVEASPVSSIDPTTGKKKKPPFRLPWWFKIVGYVLCFMIFGVASFFIIIQGITLGDDLVQQWLTSLVMSFVTGVFLTQPAQVALTTFFFVAIFRSSKEDDTGEINTGVQKRKQLKRRGSDGEDVLVNDKDAPLVNVELEEMRLKRQKELKVENILKKIVWHALFLWLVYVISYSNRDINAYVYHTNLQVNLIEYRFDPIQSTVFDDVNT